MTWPVNCAVPVSNFVFNMNDTTFYIELKITRGKLTEKSFSLIDGNDVVNFINKGEL